MTEANVISEIRQLVAKELAAVDALILAQMAGSNAPLIPLLTQHILKAGGKRLRPMVTLLSAQLCGYTGGGGRDVTMAASVEFIHTATLLHDDVVDDSKLRRGEPTANAQWGNAASVLVGDFLLAKAFQLMVADGSLEALKLLSDTSATLSEGEVLQLSAARNLQTDQPTYEKIIYAKTASLFATAAEIGAVIAGKPEWRAPLKAYGEGLGLAFQIMDDALDYRATTEAIGKRAGDDFREGKITLPVIIAHALGNEEERAFWEVALSEETQATDAAFAQAQALLAKHGAIEQSLSVADAKVEEAIAALSALPSNSASQALASLARFSVTRKN